MKRKERKRVKKHKENKHKKALKRAKYRTSTSESRTKAVKYKYDNSRKDQDLENDLRPISAYVGNPEEMVNQMFLAVKGRKLTAMLPPLLMDMKPNTLKQLCEEQLMGMSSKRIKSILEGTDLDSSSEGEEEGQLDYISSANEDLSEQLPIESTAEQSTRLSKHRESRDREEMLKEALTSVSKSSKKNRNRSLLNSPATVSSVRCAQPSTSTRIISGQGPSGSEQQSVSNSKHSVPFRKRKSSSDGGRQSKMASTTSSTGNRKRKQFSGTLDEDSVSICPTVSPRPLSRTEPTLESGLKEACQRSDTRPNKKFEVADSLIVNNCSNDGDSLEILELTMRARIIKSVLNQIPHSANNVQELGSDTQHHCDNSDDLPKLQNTSRKNVMISSSNMNNNASNIATCSSSASLLGSCVLCSRDVKLEDIDSEDDFSSCEKTETIDDVGHVMCKSAFQYRREIVEESKDSINQKSEAENETGVIETVPLHKEAPVSTATVTDDITSQRSSYRDKIFEKSDKEEGECSSDDNDTTANTVSVNSLNCSLQKSVHKSEESVSTDSVAERSPLSGVKPELGSIHSKRSPVQESSENSVPSPTQKNKNYKAIKRNYDNKKSLDLRESCEQPCEGIVKREVELFPAKLVTYQPNSACSNRKNQSSHQSVLSNETKYIQRDCVTHVSRITKRKTRKETSETESKLSKKRVKREKETVHCSKQKEVDEKTVPVVDQRKVVHVRAEAMKLSSVIKSVARKKAANLQTDDSYTRIDGEGEKKYDHSWLSCNCKEKLKGKMEERKNQASFSFCSVDSSDCVGGKSKIPDNIVKIVNNRTQDSLGRTNETNVWSQCQRKDYDCVIEASDEILRCNEHISSSRGSEHARKSCSSNRSSPTLTCGIQSEITVDSIDSSLVECSADKSLSLTDMPVGSSGTINRAAVPCKSLVQGHIESDSKPGCSSNTVYNKTVQQICMCQTNGGKFVDSSRNEIVHSQSEEEGNSNSEIVKCMTWSERYLQSNKVKKVVETSKIVNKMREKLKVTQKGQQRAVSPNPSAPLSFIEGSVAEYNMLQKLECSNSKTNEKESQ